MELIAWLVAVYAVICVGAYFGNRLFMYFPDPTRVAPAAQWTGALRGPAFFNYADNYLVDVHSAVIVDVEASRAIRQAEVGAAKIMIEARPIALACGRSGLPAIPPMGRPKC